MAASEVGKAISLSITYYFNLIINHLIYKMSQNNYLKPKIINCLLCPTLQNSSLLWHYSKKNSKSSLSRSWTRHVWHFSWKNYFKTLIVRIVADNFSVNWQSTATAKHPRMKLMTVNSLKWLWEVIWQRTFVFIGYWSFERAYTCAQR